MIVKFLMRMPACFCVAVEYHHQGHNQPQDGSYVGLLPPSDDKLVTSPGYACHQVTTTWARALPSPQGAWRWMLANATVEFRCDPP